MCTISLSLAKPWKAMPGPYIQQLDGASPACVPERSRTGGPGEEIGDQRRRRSDSTFNFKQRQSHAPHTGADPSVSRVHAGIVSSATCTDFRPQQYRYLHSHVFRLPINQSVTPEAPCPRRPPAKSACLEGPLLEAHIGTLHSPASIAPLERHYVSAAGDSPGTPLCTRAGRIPPPNNSSSIGPSLELAATISPEVPCPKRPPAKSACLEGSILELSLIHI